MNPSQHRSGPLLLALALIVALLLAACGGDSDDATDSGPTATPGPGTVLEPPKPLDDFTLTAHTGDPMSLSDLEGKVTLFYFGYTHCPDICPTSLASYKRVKANLTPEQQEQFAVVFVSVDGERDTPQHLANYVAAFDPDFIGMTGDDRAIRPVTQQFGVFYQRQDYENETNYLVDHTASTFVVGPGGQLRVIYPYGTDPAWIAQGVQRLIAES